MKIIDAEKLIRSLSSVCVTDDSIGMGIKMGLNHAIQTINDTPSVDAVKVVRCKECRFYNNDGEYCGMWGEVRHPEHFCDEGVKDNGL